METLKALILWSLILSTAVALLRHTPIGRAIICIFKTFREIVLIMCNTVEYIYKRVHMVNEKVVEHKKSLGKVIELEEKRERKVAKSK